ncbi:hypothetical protein [Flavitalea sp.]|nr:hypothetical protein [Flavitalea sp.]
MKTILQFEDANEILKPYYSALIKCLDKSFADCNAMSNFFSTQNPAHFKPRTKGSFIADRLKIHLGNQFDADSNIRFVEIKGALAVVIQEKLVVRFNKIDQRLRMSINRRTKSSKRYLNQIPMEGLEDMTYVWGGYMPDKIWSTINGYYLTCYNGNLNWHYDMGKNSSLQQLSIEIPQDKAAKRVKPKTRQGSNSNKKTGTED